MQTIDEFDLIIFDRSMLRGILPASYLGSVRDYVRRGGAVLVAAGPDYASVQSLARSPLGEVLPGLPTSRLIEELMSIKATRSQTSARPLAVSVSVDVSSDAPRREKNWL